MHHPVNMLRARCRTKTGDNPFVENDQAIFQLTALDNVGRFVRGDELRNVVTKEKWF